MNYSDMRHGYPLKSKQDMANYYTMQNKTFKDISFWKESHYGFVHVYDI